MLRRAFNILFLFIFSIAVEIFAAHADEIARCRQIVYLLAGPPNAGKGTLGRPFSAVLNIPYRSTGDALREVAESGSDLGNRIKPIMDAGGLIPGDDVFEVLRVWLLSRDPSHGFILDGSPRRLDEAIRLEKLIYEAGWKEIRVISIEATKQMIYERAGGRSVCSSRDCGRSFHQEYAPPRDPARCDACGSHLVRRKDDESLATLDRRLDVFREETIPAIDYFRAKGLVIDLKPQNNPRLVYESLLKQLSINDGSHPQ